jgi:hypothetical protein
MGIKEYQIMSLQFNRFNRYNQNQNQSQLQISLQNLPTVRFAAQKATITRVASSNSAGSRTSSQMGCEVFTVWAELVDRPGFVVRTVGKASLAELVSKAKVGDQVVFDGYLVRNHYQITHPSNFVELSSFFVEKAAVQQSRQAAESNMSDKLAGKSE